MKKVLVIISLVSVLLLSGCGKDEVIKNNANNNVSDVTVENQQQEVVSSNEIDKEENVEQYKLADGYVLEDGMYEDKYDIDYYTGENKSFSFESDGAQYTIRMSEEGNCWLLNDIEILQGGQFAKVVDFDTSDNYKELVIYSIGGTGSNCRIYRVKANNEIELIDEIEDVYLIKIRGKYLFTKGIDFIDKYVPLGYYEYLNGAFIFVDRFINGEKINDLSNFSNGEYTAWMSPIGRSGHFAILENSNITQKYFDDSIIKILNVHLDSNNNIELADIELVEDSIIKEYGSDDKMIVKKGTKLTIKFVPVG